MVNWPVLFTTHNSQLTIRFSPDVSSPSPRYALIAEGSAVGIFFPVAIVAGYLTGRWLGRWLGLGEVAAFLGAGLGVAAAFVNLWRFVKRLERP